MCEHRPKYILFLKSSQFLWGKILQRETKMSLSNLTSIIEHLTICPVRDWSKLSEYLITYLIIFTFIAFSNVARKWWVVTREGFGRCPSLSPPSPGKYFLLLGRLFKTQLWFWTSGLMEERDYSQGNKAFMIVGCKRSLLVLVGLTHWLLPDLGWADGLSWVNLALGYMSFILQQAC